LRIDVPFSVEYLTPQSVPIDEVIDSLIAIRSTLREGISILPAYVPALEIQSVQINVRRIGHESPLRELFILTLIVAFQDELKSEIPPAVEKITGMNIPSNLDGLVTVSTMIAVYYGVAFVKDLLFEKQADSPIRKQRSALVDELSDMTGRSEEEIRKILDERYKPKGKMNELARQAIRFFRPSKSQDNAPIVFQRRRIEPPVISDVPQEYAFDDELETAKSRDLYDVEIEIHAQDRDKSKTGWAALVSGQMSKRVPMKLMGDVTPDQLWQKDNVRADVTVIYKRSGLTFEPDQIHINRITD
jgi:hypothetical protein